MRLRSWSLVGDWAATMRRSTLRWIAARSSKVAVSLPLSRSSHATCDAQPGSRAKVDGQVLAPLVVANTHGRELVGNRLVSALGEGGDGSGEAVNSA